MPYGVDTSVFYPMDLPIKRDIVFVGKEYNAFQERSKKLDLLKRVYEDRFEKTGGVFFEECAKEYANSRIAFNYCSAGEINMRIFEVLACKKLLITNNVPNIHELFKDGEHLVIYNNDEELINKINYYLKNNEERKRIALNGYKEVKKHTYLKRAMEILKIIQNARTK